MVIMGTYQEIIDSTPDPQNALAKRQQLFQEIQEITGRPLLVYVADINNPQSILNHEDKTGFSDLIENVDEKEVDVLINSPGGFVEATESIVSAMRHKYDNVRFIVPNMAKSAATLLTLSGDEILMGSRSELGPIDPQVQYMTSEGPRREAAEDIVNGFEEVKGFLAEQGPEYTPAYVPLLNKITIGLLRECNNAMELSRVLAKKWLEEHMFKDENGSNKPDEITEFFASHAGTLSHNRPILIDKCIDLGLKINDLGSQENELLSAKVWELWCLYELHFEKSPVHKVYENSQGTLLQKLSGQIPIQMPPQIQPMPPQGQPRQQ